MNEVLQAVRTSLGADALILETLSVPGGDDTENEERIKVTAMRGQPKDEKTSVPQPTPEKGKGVPRQEDRQPPTPNSQLLRSTPVVRDGLDSRGWEEVSRQLTDLKSLLCWMIPGLKQSGSLEELVTQEVPPDLLIRLVQEAGETNGADQREQIRQALIRLLPTGGDVETKSERRVCLALIGPPGVGKTSAVVKLTVRLTRNNERRIGWISLDNRRVAGAEELTVCAGILGIPCEVAEGRDGLARALERLSACDLVLIDTAGLSPQDSTGLAELAGVLRGQGLPEVRCTLVLSAATNGPDLTAWVQRYGRVGFDSLLFTMVDTCAHFGPLLNTVLTCSQPLSYLATGPSVTQGLEAARAETVARLLLP